ncbi:unnamed protein product [Litomosoides sigmodontis]|uniref:Uncharacterized protein n=1 Tax=Litomosoides sigmodontis TaxID=42156 RepID=A0A3P6TGG9_LITSI|nr:unnamed protein product [Litomosoides sigmodontis]
MFHLVLTVIIYVSKQCCGQLGYGGNGYCSTCALQNSGSIVRGFGFGGSNYDLTSQSSYSLPTNNAFIMPTNSHGYGSNGYSVGTGYNSAQTSNGVNYGSPSTTGTAWNNGYSSIGNYGTGNGYINCYNNNCIPSTGYNTIPSIATGTGYSASGSNSLYNSYSSVPDMSYKIYSLLPTYSAYSNLESLPNTYTSNGNSGLETYSSPYTYGNYGSHDIRGSANSLNYLHSFPGYQRSWKVVAADDASVTRKSSPSSTSVPS